MYTCLNNTQPLVRDPLTHVMRVWEWDYISGLGMRLYFWVLEWDYVSGWECDYISGLGMRPCFWFGNVTTFLVWEWDYVSGLGTRLHFWFQNETTFWFGNVTEKCTDWGFMQFVCCTSLYRYIHCMSRCHGTILTTAVGWKALWLLQGDKERAWVEAEHSIGIIICYDGHTHWGVR